MAPGLCGKFKYGKYPIEYNVYWVRVYQDPDDPNQMFVCLTPERHTKICIKAHEEIYKNDHDVSSRFFESFMYNNMHVSSAQFTDS